MPNLRLALCVAASLLLAACAPAAPAEPPGLGGTSWTVATYHDGAEASVEVLAGTSPSVAFAADGSLSGSGGCNRIIGSFTEDGSAVAIGPLGTTRMACQNPEGVMAQEAALLAALQSAATWSVDGDRLELRTDSGVLAAELVRA